MNDKIQREHRQTLTAFVVLPLLGMTYVAAYTIRSGFPLTDFLANNIPLFVFEVLIPLVLLVVVAVSKPYRRTIHLLASIAIAVYIAVPGALSLSYFSSETGLYNLLHLLSYLFCVVLFVLGSPYSRRASLALVVLTTTLAVPFAVGLLSLNLDTYLSSICGWVIVLWGVSVFALIRIS